MSTNEENHLLSQILQAWRVNNEINLALIGAIPPAGFAAVPLNSRGRIVARQLEHMNQVRLSWLHFQTTGRRPRRSREGKGVPHTRAQLKKAFRDSGRSVEEFLSRTLAQGGKTRMFGGQPVCWMAYLISHESHHRGQIALALKQQGMRLPEKVALQGLWGRWIFGK